MCIDRYRQVLLLYEMHEVGSASRSLTVHLDNALSSRGRAASYENNKLLCPFLYTFIICFKQKKNLSYQLF